MFNFGKILRDLAAKAMMILGSSTAVAGVFTSEQWAAITGGIVAAVGGVLHIFVKSKELKDVAVVATAVDAKITTSEVLDAVNTSGVKVLAPVGATAVAKKNFSSR